MESLRQTTILKELPSECGGLFFEDVTPGTLAILKRRYGNQLPKIEESLNNFDAARFIDKHSRKPALLVRLKVITSDPKVSAFEIIKRTGRRGWVSCYVEMNHEAGRWKVCRCQVGIAD